MSKALPRRRDIARSRRRPKPAADGSLSARGRAAGASADAQSGRAGADVNGGAAALLAAGFACAVFGVLVVLAEASEAFAERLTFQQGVGSLSGKGIVTTALWLVAWPALHFALRRREVSWRATLRVTGALVGIGLLGTFPPFFQLFHGR